MNKLALGTVQFGLNYGVTNNSGQVKIEEVGSILEFAKNKDINVLDTAASYGSSEEILGSAGVGDFQVITKTTSLKSDANEVIDNFYKSLKNLDRAQVDGLLVHDISDIGNEQFDVLYRKIIELKQQGLVNKIGFSTYTPEQVDFLMNNFDFDLIQVPFNVFDNRLIQGGQLQALNNKGIEIHARSVFLQGLLLTSTKEFPAKFTQWKYLWNLWDEWLNDNNITALEATVRYSLSITEISKVLVGVHSKKHLQEIVKASYGNLPSVPKDFFTSDINLLNPSNW